MPTELTVNSGPGSALVRDIEQKPLYRAEWKEARLTAAEEGFLMGTMTTVRGGLFDPEKASSFSADDAVASKEKQSLTLTGHVVLVSVARDVKLTCDKAEWLFEEKIVKASGNVHVAGQFQSITGLNEVWATTKLDKIGTPSMFNSQP